MANYNIVVDTSNFKPMDISMGWKVLEANKDTYEKLSDKLEKIAEENGEFQLPEGTMYGDIDLSQKVKDLQNEIATTAYDINNNMSARTRGKAQQFFMRYKKEMTPIKKMVTAYNQEVDKLNALRAQDSSTIVLNPPRLESFYGGVKPSATQTISGASLAKDIATSIGATLRSQAQKLGISSTGIEGVLKAIKESRLSAEDLYNISNNPSYANTLGKDTRAIASVIGNIVENIKQSYGYYGITDGQQKNKFQVYLNLGLQAALAQTPSDVGTIQDPRPSLNLDRARLALSQRAQSFEEQKYYDQLNSGSSDNISKGKEEEYYFVGGSGKENIRVIGTRNAYNNLYVYAKDDRDNPIIKSTSGIVIDGNHQKYMDKNKKVSIPKFAVNGQVLIPRNYNSNTNVVTFSNGIQYDLKTRRFLDNSSSSQSSSSSNSRRSQTTTQSRPKPTTRPKPTSSSKTSNIDIESALDNGSDEGGSAD